jgi:hypothetical protein
MFRFWMENGGGGAEERERITAAPSLLCAGSPAQVEAAAGKAQVEGRRHGRRRRRGGKAFFAKRGTDSERLGRWACVRGSGERRFTKQKV